MQTCFSANDAEKIRFHHAKEAARTRLRGEREKGENIGPEMRHRCLIVDGIISGNANE